MRDHSNQTCTLKVHLQSLVGEIEQIQAKPELLWSNWLGLHVCYICIDPGTHLTITGDKSEVCQLFLLSEPLRWLDGSHCSSLWQTARLLLSLSLLLTSWLTSLIFTVDFCPLKHSGLNGALQLYYCKSGSMLPPPSWSRSLPSTLLRSATDQAP